jgi:hypothetical protein
MPEAKEKSVRLTKAQAEHLLTILRWNGQTGTYCGNRDQYWKRHFGIEKKLSVMVVEFGDK